LKQLTGRRMIEITVDDEGTFSVYKNDRWIETKLNGNLGGYIVQLLNENSSQTVSVKKPQLKKHIMKLIQSYRVKDGNQD